MNASQISLLEKIKHFSLDEQDASFSFTVRLAREQAWSLGYAARVCDEYKRFMFLAVIAEHPVTPSVDVDAVWHLHLLYTRSYWHSWCNETLEKEIHHEPTRGGNAEDEKFHNWYTATLQSYIHYFGKEAPIDIWPSTNDRFTQGVAARWVNPDTHFIVPRINHLLKSLGALF